RNSRVTRAKSQSSQTYKKVIYEGRADVNSSVPPLRRRVRAAAPVAVRASHLFERVSWWTCGEQAAQSGSDRPVREVMTFGERAWTDRSEERRVGKGRRWRGSR